MNLTWISIILWVIAILIFITYLETRRDKKMFNLEKEIKELLTITASLKLRVYDHEKYLLEKDGVFIPEDMGEYYFKQTWALIDDETKELISNEYKDVCPESIPLWKYFLYSYKPEIKIQRKIKMKKVESVEDLINSTSKSIDELTKQFAEMQQKSVEVIKTQTDNLLEVEKEIKDIKGSIQDNN